MYLVRCTFYFLHFTFYFLLLTFDFWLLILDSWLLTFDSFLLTLDSWLLTLNYWLLTLYIQCSIWYSNKQLYRTLNDGVNVHFYNGSALQANPTAWTLGSIVLIPIYVLRKVKGSIFGGQNTIFLLKLSDFCWLLKIFVQPSKKL